ncbi:putative nucleotide-binding protein containing TIR-like domain protein [compost metagenome]
MKAKIFIGSSVESRKIAFAIQENLDYDANCTVWTQGVFDLSQTALTSLLNQVHTNDFAVFVFGQDDMTKMRNQEKSTVRDNVIFETGLFIGGIGNERVFFVSPSDNSDLHLPTDLLGITPGRFDSTRDDHTAALGSFCNQIRKQIELLGPIKKTTEKEEWVDTKATMKVSNYTDEHKEFDRNVCLKIKEFAQPIF